MKPSTKKPKPLEIAPHTVEPYDGTEGMVKCIECRKKYGCRRRVPSMDKVMQHCNSFTPVQQPAQQR